MFSALLHGLREAVRRYREARAVRMCLDAYYAQGRPVRRWDRWR